MRIVTKFNRMDMISVGKITEMDDILNLTRACGQHMQDNGIDQWDTEDPKSSGHITGYSDPDLICVS